MNKAAMWTCVLILCLFAAMTFRRNETWNNEIALWRDTVAKSPDKVRPHWLLAQAYFDNREWQNAENEYRLVIERFGQERPVLSSHSDAESDLRTYEIYAYANIGAIYVEEQRWLEAEALLNLVLEIDPHNTIALINKAALVKRLDDRAKCEKLQAQFGRNVQAFKDNYGTIDIVCK